MGADCHGGLDLGSWAGYPASPKPPLNPGLDLGRNHGCPLLQAPHQLIGSAGLLVLMGTLTTHGASLAKEHCLSKQRVLRENRPQTMVGVTHKYSLEILESGSWDRLPIKWSGSLTVS